MESLSTLVDPGEVSKFAVQDHEGLLHQTVEHRPRPAPFCVECRREVKTLSAFDVEGRIVFTVGCHGEWDVVKFDIRGDLTVALPCFQDTPIERRRILEQLTPWASGREFD